MAITQDHKTRFDSLRSALLFADRAIRIAERQADPDKDELPGLLERRSGIVSEISLMKVELGFPHLNDHDFEQRLRWATRGAGTRSEQRRKKQLADRIGGDGAVGA